MARAMGRYELLRPLARGGMAEVFLARRRSGGVEKLLVLKRIRAERATDARFLELFVREAKVSMSLAHQNIVPVFDFGRIGDRVFLAMERVEGKDLGSSLARSGVPPVAPVVAAFIAAECCRALAHAHQRGVVHRDVTPRNVLVSWSGEVKLTDFGIAALAGDADGRLVGTPAYMAPEQARGEPVDGRADLYALGLVLREAVTGMRARPGGDRDALVAAARRGELAPWSASCPRALVAVVDRATCVDRGERWPDARAMLAALDAYIVAERAVHAGDAPDRQLADWLARAWDGEPSDDAPADAPDGAVAESLVFDDDDDAVGSGTERSLAATAADAAPPPARDVEERLPDATAPVVDTPARDREKRRRRFVAIVALVGVVVLASGVAVVMQRGDRAAPIDAGVGSEAHSIDAAPTLDANVGEPPRDAPRAIDATSLDAPPLDAARATDAQRARDAAIAVTVDAAPIVLRKVRINARPWATFTVDGGTTQHETISTIELAPGRHKLRFANPELGVVREVTIDVPADRDLDHVEDLRR